MIEENKSQDRPLQVFAKLMGLSIVLGAIAAGAYVVRQSTGNEAIASLATEVELIPGVMAPVVGLLALPSLLEWAGEEIGKACRHLRLPFAPK